MHQTATCDNPTPVTNGLKNSHPHGQVNGNAVDKRKCEENTEHRNGTFVVQVPPKQPPYTNNVPDKTTNGNGIVARTDKYSGLYPPYDPYEHYFEKHPTTYWGSVVHFLKVGLGAGVLAMPNAFHNAGWLLGTILTFAIGFLCTYTVHMLISAEYELCKRRKVPSLTMAEIVEYAFEDGPKCTRWFAPWGKFFIDFFLIMYQLGTSAIYIVFIASNFKQVHDTYFEDDLNIRLLMLYLMVPLVLICWVRDLKMLTPFSTAADITVLMSFIVIFVFIFQDLPSLADRKAIGKIQSIPLFFGTVMFAMEAIGVVMPLKNTMKEPRRFGGAFGVVNTSMVPIMFLYALLGFFGYLKYGSDTRGSITLNLPKNDGFANAAKIMHSSSMYISYALSNFIIFDIVWKNGIKKKFDGQKNKFVWEYVMRTGIALLTILMAIAIPNLEVFISLTGSFCLSVLALAAPAAVHTCTFWRNRGRNILRFSLLMIRNVILVLLAMFAFVVGVSSAIMQYMNEKAAHCTRCA